MGTRHITEVIVDGEMKISQYGQWDGYPTGQGDTIAEFLKTVDLPKLKEQVKALGTYSQADIKKAYKDAGDTSTDGWVSSDIADKVKAAHPEMSRDTGASVLQLIHDGITTRVNLDKDFKNDTLFCEYVYTINLDDETVTIGSKTFSFQEWTPELMKQLEADENNE